MCSVKHGFLIGIFRAFSEIPGASGNFWFFNSAAGSTQKYAFHDRPDF